MTQSGGGEHGSFRGPRKKTLAVGFNKNLKDILDQGLSYVEQAVTISLSRRAAFNHGEQDHDSTISDELEFLSYLLDEKRAALSSGTVATADVAFAVHKMIPFVPDNNLV